MENGEPLACFGMLIDDIGSAINIYGAVGFAGTKWGVPCIALFFELANLSLYWTADGLSMDMPSNENPPVD